MSISSFVFKQRWAKRNEREMHGERSASRGRAPRELGRRRGTCRQAAAEPRVILERAEWKTEKIVRIAYPATRGPW